MRKVLENALLRRYYNAVQNYWMTYRSLTESGDVEYSSKPIPYQNLVVALSAYRKSQHPWSEALTVAAFCEFYPYHYNFYQHLSYYWGNPQNLFHPNSKKLIDCLENSGMFIHNTQTPGTTYENLMAAYTAYISCYDAMPSAIQADLLRTVFRS